MITIIDLFWWGVAGLVACTLIMLLWPLACFVVDRLAGRKRRKRRKRPID